MVRIKFLIVILVLLSGCSFSQSDWHKINAAISASTSIAIHEYGHKTDLDAFGADSTVHLSPRRDSNGRFQLGLTTYNKGGL